MAQHHSAVAGGQEVRVGSGGLAFAVGIDTPGDISLDSSVNRHLDAGESVLTAGQINDKLAAAEARRQAALNEVRQRGAEEGAKVEKASEHRQQAVEEIKEALELKLDNAQANQDEIRQALLDRLRKEEIHHEEILGRRAEDFHSRIREMDVCYKEKEGNRHQVLEEIVDKVKEHNDRVKAIHDEIMAHRKQDRIDGEKEAALRKRWMDASNQRDVYVSSAESRLRSENLY